MSSSPCLAVRPQVGWTALLECASIEVVELMAGVRLKPWTVPYNQPRSELATIVGMAGAHRGMTIVGCSRKTARNLGSRMVGEATTVADTTICDALGEICNMIAENLKSKIPGLADGCKLSVSALLSGGDFCLRGIEADSTIHVAFRWMKSRSGSRSWFVPRASPRLPGLPGRAAGELNGSSRPPSECDDSPRIPLASQ